jgi:hypothetical protein
MLVRVQIMQHAALNAAMPMYAKLGRLIEIVLSYCKYLEANNGRQAELRRKKIEAAKHRSLSSNFNSTSIGVQLISPSVRESIPRTYLPLIEDLEALADYEVLQLVDHLPSERKDKWFYLEGLELPFRAVVSTQEVRETVIARVDFAAPTLVR